MAEHRPLGFSPATLKSFKVLARSKILLAGISMFSFFVLVGCLEPILVPYNAATIGRFTINLPPSPAHLLGTDSTGRDIYGQLVEGTKNSLLIGLIAGAFGTMLGGLIGLIAGYRGGLADDGLRSTTDVFLVIPLWPLLVLISAYVRTLSAPSMSMLLAAFSWPWPARAIRSQVMSLKEREFINLAKISGMSEFEIAVKEVMPNVLPYMGMVFAISVSGAMLAEVGLEIIGLGPQGIITLGLMLNYAYYHGALVRGILPWIFGPIIILILIFLALQFINIGLDEVYNPRLKKITGA